MRQRWLCLVLLAGLFLSVVPAAATQRFVDPTEEPEPILEPAEVEKIAALQNVDFPVIYGPVSPDDTSLFTAIFSREGVRLQFVNVNDSSAVPIDDLALSLGPLTDVAWIGDHTARYVSIDENFSPVLVDIDSRTGAVVTDTFDLPGFPISLAPNGSRLMVAIVEETPDEGEDVEVEGRDDFRLKTLSREPFKLEVESPFTIPLKRAPLVRQGPRGFDQPTGDVMLSATTVTFAVLDFTTGEVVPLVMLPENSGLTSPPAWTPDGSKLAYSRYTIPLIGRSGTPLADVATQDTLGNLPPAENPFFQGSAIDSFDFTTGDFRPAALRAPDGNGDLFSSAQWSPDGQTLVTTMQRPARLTGRRYPLYLYSESTYLNFYDASFTPISSFDRIEISSPFSTVPLWISNDELAIRTVYGLSYRIYYHNRISGEFRQVSPLDGTYDQVRATRGSRLMIFNHSSFQRPYDLYRIQWDGQALAGLTFLNYDVAELNQVRADVVTFRLRGGVTRTGYLVQPAGAAFPPRNVPIIAWQEGGPGPAMTNAWGSNVENPYNLLANFGFAVLVMPLPGRDGWGPQFYKGLADGRNFGQIDIDEQAQITEQLIRGGWTSRGKVGITGCSYGGYFTSQSITRYPTLYAAANTQCSLLDLYAEFQFGFTPVLGYLMGRSPTTDPEEYTRDSPLYNSARVRTPLLMFHGERDFLPYQLALNFHDQVAANGTPVDLIQFAGEGHGLGSPVSQLVAAQAQIDWFRRYLGGAQTAAVKAPATAARR